MEKDKYAPRAKMNNQEESALDQVLTDFQKAQNGILTSCYHGINATGDWNFQWDRQEKMADGYYVPATQDDPRANVKSPMALGRIEGSVNKLRKLNLGYTVKPMNTDSPEAKRKAKVIEALLNNFIQSKRIKSRLISWEKDILVHGNGFLQIYYLEKSRKVKMIPSEASELNEEQKEEVKQGKRVYVEKEIYDYKDIAFEPVKLQEMYWDPSARYFHGESYDAQYCIRRMLPSYEQFMAIFGDDDDVKNLKDVKPASAYSPAEREFFKAPKDYTGSNYVQVLHYYNKAEDRYVVVANNVVIKDMPLPYNHKQLPFIMGTLYEKPHFMLGSGIPDRLIPIQTEEETLKNMTYDRLHITANPMLLVKKNIYGEFSKAYQTSEPGMMLPVNDTGSDIRTLDYPATSFDLFKALELLQGDAVTATQIDPNALSMGKYVGATVAMYTKEQAEEYIASFVDNLAAPLGVAGEMILKLMEQFYTQDDYDKYVGKGGEGRMMMLEGIEINPNTLEIKKLGAGEYSHFRIKKEYFDIDGEWAITITSDSREVPSKALDIQKAQANISQLAPFMVDPNDKTKLTAHPAPWVDGPKMLKWYFESNTIPKDMLVEIREDEDISMQRASDQGKMLMNGETVPGIPGESDAHKRVHVKQLMALNEKIQEAKKNQEKLGPYAVQYADFLPETEQLNKDIQVAQAVAEHLALDDTPRNQAEQTTLQKTQMLTTPPQPPQPPQPLSVPMPPGLNMGGAGQPVGPTFNQNSGMMPEMPAAPEMGAPEGTPASTNPNLNM